MSQLRSRVLKMEMSKAPAPHAGFLRIIRRGDLTAEEEARVEHANATGKLVIIRRIIEPIFR